MLSSQTSQSALLPADWLSSRQKWILAAIGPVFLAPIWFNITLPASLATLSGLILSLLLVVSTVTDISQRRICNWATYSAFAYAIAINAVLTQTKWSGAIGFSECLIGAGVCFVLMLVPYTMARGGAGDVKLATAIGALCGVSDGLLAIAFTYIIAGVAILGWTILSRGPLVLVNALLRRFAATLFPARIAMPDDQQDVLLNQPIPLAGFFALGTLCVVFDVPQLLRAM